jgi:hypothetical protein
VAELRYTHIDALAWQEVRALVGDDGRRLAAREKFLEFSERRMSLYAEWDPGMVVHRHGHNSEQIVFVIDGSVEIDGRHCGPGTFMVLEQGATMGPMIAGPQGVRMFESYDGDPRSWAADPAEHERVLAERGLTPAPLAAIDMIEAFPDTRS